MLNKLIMLNVFFELTGPFQVHPRKKHNIHHYR